MNKLRFVSESPIEFIKVALGKILLIHGIPGLAWGGSTSTASSIPGVGTDGVDADAAALTARPCSLRLSEWAK